MKSYLFNGLLMLAAVATAYLPMRSLPARPALPPAMISMELRPVDLKPIAGPLKLAGAWELAVPDRRFGGISSLTIDGGSFLAVSDRGAIARFDRPGATGPRAWIADLKDGPGPWGKKWSRDAESLAPDPGGRGWWVGYEQNHSLWLYDPTFEEALASINLKRPDWWNNRGAEGLVAEGGELLVTAENGREAMLVSKAAHRRLTLDAGADIADAARGPDGRIWLLLRTKRVQGLNQSVVPLTRSGDSYRVGERWALPKGAFDNYEGLAIEPRPGGGMRFWLISDDGHRIMARTLLVALDLLPAARHDKSPARGAGLSKEPAGNGP